MTRLWDKGEALDARIARFTVGRDAELDLALVAHDARASAAHAIMLFEIGVLSEKSCAALIHELGAIADEAEDGRFTIDVADEDCHTAIENRLTERVGEAGKRIHTGRSRNDQVIAALRLFGREAIIELADALVNITNALLSLALTYRDTTMPGYTHTRQAMPSTMGFFFAAYADGLLDTIPWLQTAYDHLNRSPLGSASGYGVALALNRPRVSELLAFDHVQVNTLAVQNDRGRTEYAVLGAVLLPITDLGRLAADLIDFSNDEFRFIRLASSITTGSSIMPQKRNPDVLELIRAKSAELKQHHAGIGAIYGQLGAGYHRDLQLTKAPFIEGMRTAIDIMNVAMPVLDGLEVDRDRCHALVLKSTCATDEVYQRVAQGTPFRDAYRHVGADPESLTKANPDDAWRTRQHLGAPGRLEIDSYRKRLKEAGDWIDVQRSRFSSINQIWRYPIFDKPYEEQNSEQRKGGADA